MLPESKKQFNNPDLISEKQKLIGEFKEIEEKMKNVPDEKEKIGLLERKRDILREMVELKGRAEEESKLQDNISKIKELKSNKKELSESIEEIKLLEQYEAQKTILMDRGIIEKLPSGLWGMKCADGKMHTLPTFEEILSVIEKKGDFFKSKISQGLTKLIITPIGMSIRDLEKKYGDMLIEYYKNNKKILIPKENNFNIQDLEIGVNAARPFKDWGDKYGEDYANLDVEGKFVYGPSVFGRGSEKFDYKQTKMGLLESNNGAWNIILAEDAPSLPIRSRELNGRESLNETNSCTGFIDIIRNDSQYKGEEGFTVEDWIMYAITRLYEHNEIIDNKDSGSSPCAIVGMYFKESNFGPYIYWSSKNGQFIFTSDIYIDKNSRLRTCVKII